MDDNSQQSDLADNDLLRGASAIAEHLRSVGLDNVDESKIYYFARSKKLSIGRFGKDLIASKKRLSRDLQRAAKAIPQSA
jgi:hypothetical protein